MNTILLAVPGTLKDSSYVCILSLISYTVGCMFVRYSLDVEGLVRQHRRKVLQSYCKFS